ncbi:beta-galactosidase [Pedobacter sp. KBW01]|uniref:sugar-binding domain-containing protein n=1 Tax=Pedobacter sp. KBW01 TaxID=2153364 RepID=UPI000F5B528D|nr:sugar-binding domain-containing protein [Pedobacter sp. KBW01]RQO73545.1 beta-galactosidase [Pedobacter sp. KBW01]
MKKYAYPGFYYSAVTVLLMLIALKSSAQQAFNGNKELFDYGWKFNLADKSDNFSTPEFDDRNWRARDLPHDWSIEGRIDAKNPMGNDGGYFPAGIGWYRKAFSIPANWKNKKVSIYFEGVYMNAEVFINGKSLGVYPYGYSSFTYDLSPYLKYGTKNTIAVRVDNAQQKNSRWYSGSGIYRHVWLMSKDPVHFDQWGIFVTTPTVSASKAIVRVEAKLNNDTDQPKNVAVSISVFDKSHRKAATKTIQVKLQPRSSNSITENLALNNPLLWDIKAPNLYYAIVEIKDNKKLLDKEIQNFGIRSIKFSPTKGFELNGKTIKLNGGCVHHDNGSLGAAAFDRAEERKAELLKAAGFNAIRTSHNPPSPAFLDACDKLGLLVIDEAFDGWRTGKNKYDYALYFNDWSERDIAAMVKRDRNHPAIIMWSIGNEIIERKEAKAVETAKLLSSYVKKHDQTRPVTSAMTTWDKDWEMFDPLMAAHDVAGYNYQLHHAAADHTRIPSRIIVQTESYPRDAFTNWELVQQNNYIIGDFVWTAMDYLGESGIGRYYYPGELEGQHWERDLFPWHGAYCGDIDLTGWRKPISHYRSMLYNDNEKIYMAVKEPNPANGVIKETMWSVWPSWESWTWPGCEGKEIQVEVYSKYPAVRLYLNNKLIGEKTTTVKQQFKATFPLAYQQGQLKAVGILNGQEKEAVILSTSGQAAQIRLKADRKRLYANGQDLSFVTVEIVDKQGNIRPDANHSLTFKLSGAATIAATDNADLKDITPYTSNTRKPWNGRAMVIVKSSDKAGNIKLQVSSPGLPDAWLELTSINKGRK